MQALGVGGGLTTRASSRSLKLFRPQPNGSLKEMRAQPEDLVLADREVAVGVLLGRHHGPFRSRGPRPHRVQLADGEADIGEQLAQVGIRQFDALQAAIRIHRSHIHHAHAADLPRPPQTAKIHVLRQIPSTQIEPAGAAR